MGGTTIHETTVEKLSTRKTPNRYSAGVLKVMSIFGGVQMVNIICAVVRTKLVAILIGAAGVGLFGIFNSAIEMISGLTMLGIDTSSVRDMAAASEGRKRIVALTVRRLGWILGIIGSIAMAALSPVLSSYSFGTTANAWQFIVLSVCMFFNALTRTNLAILQGLKRFRNLARSSVWGAVAGVAISAPLFYFFGIRSIVPALIGFTFAAYIPSVINAEKLPDIKISRRETWLTCKDFLRLGAYMTATTFAASLVNYLFMSWLNGAADVTIVGYYQAGHTLFYRYAGLVFAAIVVEYYPRLSSVATKRRATTTFVNHEATLLMWILLGIVPAFILAAPLLVRILYAADFMIVIPLVTLGITGTVLRGISWCMSFTILARGDGRLFLITELTSEALALLLNIAGYKIAGLAGLGAAYVIWYAVYTAMIYAIYAFHYRLRLYPRTILQTAAVLTVSAISAAIALGGFPWWLNLPVVAGAVAVAFIQLRKLYR